MDHRSPSLLCSVRPRLTCALAIVLLAACTASDGGEVRVLTDTSDVRSGLEVIALPFDPATLAPPRDDSPRADSLRRYELLADSARTAARTFTDERAAINAAVLGLRSADRTTRAYAADERVLRERIDAAERMRARRDTLRTRAATFARTLGLADDVETGARRFAWAAVDSAESAADRQLVAAAAADTVSLRLSPGRWWITIGRSGEFIRGDATSVDVRRGSSAHIRLVR